MSTATTDWHRVIDAETRLPLEAEQQLRRQGFVVMPGPPISGGSKQLSDAYDRAVSAADPADVFMGKTGSSARVENFADRSPVFDGLYVFPPVLAACCKIIGGPFKLSGMRARTVYPGAPMERLHVDVKHQADAWPLVGCIWMIDAFEAENGATRFVPGTHLQMREPTDAMLDFTDARKDEVLACGPAGAIIIFNASTWHGHSANRTDRPRRSIQAHFVPRASKDATDQIALIRPETLARIGDLAKYVLAL